MFCQAILRLVPDFKPEIDALISTPLTDVNGMIDCVRLERELEIANQDLSDIKQKLETEEIEKKNIRGISV